MTKRASPVDRTEFANIWQNASTAQEVADALGIKRTTAYVIASHMRRDGVPLKDMKALGLSANDQGHVMLRQLTPQATAEEFAAWKSAATARGVSLEAWVRYVLDQAALNAGTLSMEHLANAALGVRP